MDPFKLHMEVEINEFSSFGSFKSNLNKYLESYDISDKVIYQKNKFLSSFLNLILKNSNLDFSKNYFDHLKNKCEQFSSLNKSE